MYTFWVLRKSDGELVFKYDADAPIEWGTYPFADYTHEQHDLETQVPPPPPPPPHVRLTKLEFMRRFSQNERIAFRMAAANNWQLADYLHMLDLAEEVFIDDPDTVNGVQALEAMNIIAPGRATEILNV
jgi:hypothetical protein